MLKDNSVQTENHLLAKKKYSLDEWVKLLTTKDISKKEKIKLRSYEKNLTGETMFSVFKSFDKDTRVHHSLWTPQLEEGREIIINKGIFKYLCIDVGGSVELVNLRGSKFEKLYIKKEEDVICHKELSVSNIDANYFSIYFNDSDDERCDMTKVSLSNVSSNILCLNSSSNNKVINSSFKGIKAYELRLNGTDFYDCVFEDVMANSCSSEGRLDKSCQFKNVELDGVSILDNDLSLEAAKSAQKFRKKKEQENKPEPVVNF